MAILSSLIVLAFNSSNVELTILWIIYGGITIPYNILRHELIISSICEALMVPSLLTSNIMKLNLIWFSILSLVNIDIPIINSLKFIVLSSLVSNTLNIRFATIESSIPSAKQNSM